MGKRYVFKFSENDPVIDAWLSCQSKNNESFRQVIYDVAKKYRAVDYCRKDDFTGNRGRAPAHDILSEISTEDSQAVNKEPTKEIMVDKPFMSKESKRNDNILHSDSNHEANHEVNHEANEANDTVNKVRDIERDKIDTTPKSIPERSHDVQFGEGQKFAEAEKTDEGASLFVDNFDKDNETTNKRVLNESSDSGALDDPLSLFM